MSNLWNSRTNSIIDGIEYKNISLKICSIQFWVLGFVCLLLEVTGAQQLNTIWFISIHLSSKDGNASAESEECRQGRSLACAVND